MYEAFYGFVQSPFTLAPDPRFLYLSESHDEAIHLLLQSIRRKEGFIVLTGDIGTGKTTLCRALLERLGGATFTSLVLNPFVTVEELLREILLDFGVVSRQAVRSGRLAGATKHDLIGTLHDFLLSLVPIHGSAVLIIDEAQHLPPEVLEQIRVISNLETNDAKLLQIVLVGQLNLLDVLAQAQMRQLDQRISLRAVLRPLTPIEVETYIAHRLAVASGAARVTFDKDAAARVHAITEGIPRVINLLCDRALSIGARDGADAITPRIVGDAAQTLGLKAAAPPATSGWWHRVPRWAIAASAALVLTGVLLALPWPRLVEAEPLPAPVAPALTGAAAWRPTAPGTASDELAALVAAPPPPRLPRSLPEP